jgi:Uma2 family endonuclease
MHLMSISAEPVGAENADQLVTLYGVSWQAYELLLQARGESAVPRLTYLEGTLELMSPGLVHETDKITLGRLLEAWADESDVMLEGAGSWTVKRRRAKRGAEADECYVVGRSARRVRRPDIAIEVVSTRGVIDKLDVWRKLSVPEVWVWEGDELSFYVARGERYVRRERSRLLPSFDPRLAAECMRAPTQTQAVKKLRKKLRRR